VGKLLKVIADLVERVRQSAASTFSVNLRLLLRHVEKEAAAKFGVFNSADVSQRLVFGNLIITALCDDELMQGQQAAVPDHDWRRSRVIVCEMLRALSFRGRLRHHASVCEIVEGQRAAVQDQLVAATRFAIQGVGSSLDDSLLSIVEQINHKAETQEQFARPWLTLHRALSLHRDRIVNSITELEQVHGVVLDQEFDPRRFRSILERMGPPGAVNEAAAAGAGDAEAAPSLATAAAPLFKTLRKGSVSVGVSRSPTPMDRLSSGNLTEGVSLFQVEQETASTLLLAQRLAAFKEQADASVLVLSSCGLAQCPDVSRLTMLTSLNLAHNRISVLPMSLFQLALLEDLDVSHNLLEKLPFRGLTGMPRLAKLSLAGNPLPTPLNFIASGVSAVDTLYFLRHIEEFVLVYKAASREILPEEKAWASVEGVLRSLPTSHLVQWASFAIDYQLHQANKNSSRAGGGGGGGGSSGGTPRFSRFLGKQKSSEKVLSVDALIDKQVLTFGYGAKDLVPVFKRVKTTVQICNVTAGKIVFSCHAPVTQVAKIECEPREFTVLKGKSATLDVFLTFVCTTTLQEAIRVEMEPLGLTLFLWVMAQSSVSFELDAKEIEFEERIGAGGAATVFKGKWRGMEVACKRIVTYTNEDDEGVVEAKMLCHLRHFNILVFYGIARQDGLSTIVTEYMPLGSLHRVLGDASVELPWWLRVKFAQDTADALRYLHNKKIMHRDLKSSNLLVHSLAPHEICNVKLCDFGIARTVDTNMTLAQGTTLWMAPEVFSKLPYMFSADVWSFGIILGELATREEPFAKLSFFDALSQMSKGALPDLPEGTPEAFCELRRRCIQVAPEDRPSAEVLYEMIEQAVARNAELAPPSLEPIGGRPSSLIGAEEDRRVVSGEDIKSLIFALESGGWDSEGGRSSLSTSIDVASPRNDVT
jgi:tRNA A-37 threonylcarbamoyl transferase component Bud32